MFENTIGQGQVVARLRRDIVNRALPQTLLLEGPRFCGKLTVALEIGRVLTCHKQGDWDCGCRSCVQQRLLLHPALLMVGGRYFLRDIERCLQALQRSGSSTATYRFLRSVRTLTRRFDPLLREGSSAASAALEAVEDAVAAIDPERPSATQLRSSSISAFSAARRLVDMLPMDGVPIRTVRAISAWTRVTSDDAARVIIIEQSEQLNMAAANALLKILEQPPNGVYFVLLTSHRSLLPETIQSRARPYRLIERGTQEVAHILQQLFEEPEEVASTYRRIGDYFQSSEIGDLARLFLNSIADPADDVDVARKIEATLSGGNRREERRLFFEQLTGLLWEQMRAQVMPKMEVHHLLRLEHRQLLVGEHYRYSETLNIGLAQVTASLLQALRMDTIDA